MRINIQTSGFKLTDGLREHTERRLRFALSWAVYEVRKVVVRLSDINGPRGGDDKRCCIQIPISGRPDIVVEDTESDLYAAIDRAVNRVERSVARRLERKHEYRHESFKTAAA
jgi:ribosomal subunit interface protein